jgi:hypothetical protein
MIASKLFYLSLLSVSWMSAVSAGLTSHQRQHIQRFLNNLDNGHGLVDMIQLFFPPSPEIYSDVFQPMLLDYFSEWIGRFGLAVNHYLQIELDLFISDRYLPPARDPDLNQEWNVLPRVVCLIKYSNISFLNGLMRTFAIDHYPLGMINDAYLRSVSNLFPLGNPTEEESSFEPYILEVAVLFSMNQIMLPRIPAENLIHATLVRYLDISFRLHYHMARYMQLDSLIPYSWTFNSLKHEFDRLETMEDNILRTDDLRTALELWSNAVLSMIAIYGTPSINQSPYTPGTEKICALLNNQWSVRRLMGWQYHSTLGIPSWYKILLNTIAAELDLTLIETVYGARHPWVSGIRPMITQAKELIRGSSFFRDTN